MMEPAMIHPLDSTQGKAKEKHWKQRKWAGHCCLLLPPTTTHMSSVCCFGRREALNRQEDLKLAEQSEKYLELFMYEWLQGGKGRLIWIDQVKPWGQRWKQPFAIRWVTWSWTAFSFPSVHTPSCSQALPWSPFERSIHRYLLNPAIAQRMPTTLILY